VTTKAIITFKTAESAYDMEYAMGQGLEVWTDREGNVLTLDADKQRVDDDSPEDFEESLLGWLDLASDPLPLPEYEDGKTYPEYWGITEVLVDQEGAITKRSF
jgi:hypothetical protein